MRLSNKAVAEVLGADVALEDSDLPLPAVHGARHVQHHTIVRRNTESTPGH